MSAKPYLRPTPEELHKCLLCNKNIVGKEVFQEIHEQGLVTVQAKAKEWAVINIPTEEELYYQFTQVEKRLGNINPQAHCFAHSSCRITFRSQVNRCKDKYPKRDIEAEPLQQIPELEDPPTSMLDRKSARHGCPEKLICFICDVKQPNEENKSSHAGGLARCSIKSSREKLSKAKTKWLYSDHELSAAAEHLQLLISGEAHDIFAADIYYHKKCYMQFIRGIRNDDDSDVKNEECSENEENICQRVKEEFFCLIEKRVIEDKGAYLLTELLEDIKELSYDNGLQEPIIQHSHILKKQLQDRFGELIGIHTEKRKLLVHPNNINPCTYATATLEGAGLRDDDLMKAFSRMIKRKVSQRKPQKWPLSPDELLSELDKKGPFPYLYNVIAWSKDPKRRKNKHGFVITPTQLEAEKIWAISSDWKALISGERPAKSAALSLTLHRLTGSKEAVSLLHKCGHGISYADVRLLNNDWAKSVTRQTVPSTLTEGIPAHVTLDNSDGRQQTLTGAHTTHHTNGTVFQNPREHRGEEAIPVPKKNVLPREETREYGYYKIPKKVSPPALPGYVDDKNTNLLKWALQRDLAWVLTSALGKEMAGDDHEFEPVGSWTTFMKQVTTTETKKCVLEYLEVIPIPPNDTVCKWYMDMVMQMAEDLGVDCMFAHADEAVNCKLVLIQWLHQGKYDKIVTLLGGFHTILVKLKIMYKKYGALGLKDWWVYSGAVAEGSAQQAVEGRHYYRSVRLHKQSFEALIRIRLEQIDPSNFGDAFKTKVASLHQHSSPETLDNLMKDEQFTVLCTELFTYTGTQSQMVVEYMKDVSHLLALVSSVRENDISRHLQAERVLLPQLFAFGHVNYARYLTYQHLTLQGLEKSNPSAWKELKENGFGGSLSGQPFSAEHGDLITETTINREVKVRGGLMQGGYSTNVEATDVFIKTSHIMAKVRAALKDRLHMLTSTIHKEATAGAKRKHEEVVAKLVEHLKKLIDPFQSGEARHLKTGVLIDISVVRGLLGSTDVGESLFTKFVEERMKNAGEDRVSFFQPISNPRIKTGMEKGKHQEKVVNILKEDKQAFGCLVGKAISPEIAHSHPLTSVPLALSSPERNLRKGNKASLRNFLIKESNALTEDVPLHAVWLIDGMAAVRSCSPCDTWGDFAKGLITYCLPPKHFNPDTLILVMDAYGDNTVKEAAKGKKGGKGPRTYITSEHQEMPTGKDWTAFLCNGDNKNELVSFLAKYCKTKQVRESLPIPIVVTEAHRTWLINSSGVEELETCNHYEADTRIIYHVARTSKPVVVQASDTDILILLLYACVLVKPTEAWCMRIDSQQYVNIQTIYNEFGEEVCKVLPAYHSITGCDTTAFPLNVGKLRPLNKMINTQTVSLLFNLGKPNHSEEDWQDELKFMQTNMYGGKPNETFLQTRIRCYNKQKVKSSSTLLPDISSATQHIKRAHLQATIWLQCLLPQINYPSALGYGWQETEHGLGPLWFTCSQLPPCLSRRPPRSQRAQIPESYSADCETTDDNDNQPRAKRRRQHVVQQPLSATSSGSESTAGDSSHFSDSNEDSEATDG